MNFDLVCEGGGVKGVALAGALSVMEAAGYTLASAVGTSAGAIMAALAVSGYKADDIRRIVTETPLSTFCDKSLLDRLPIIGTLVSLVVDLGLYEGDCFYQWMKDLLEHAPNGPVRTFADLKKHDPLNPNAGWRLQVVASDISLRRMLVLPKSAALYGVTPDDLEVALAVRMSMSIPYFFEPVRLQGSVICDGGCLSNFPVSILDAPRGATPRWPTFGFLLVTPGEAKPNRIRGPVTLGMALVETMLAARDEFDRMKASDFVRTVAIETAGVSGTDFNLTAAQADRLWDSGRVAASEFLKTWDWEKYLSDWR